MPRSGTKSCRISGRSSRRFLSAGFWPTSNWRCQTKRVTKPPASSVSRASGRLPNSLSSRLAIRASTRRSAATKASAILLAPLALSTAAGAESSRLRPGAAAITTRCARRPSSPPPNSRASPSGKTPCRPDLPTSACNSPAMRCAGIWRICRPRNASREPRKACSSRSTTASSMPRASTPGWCAMTGSASCTVLDNVSLRTEPRGQDRAAWHAA